MPPALRVRSLWKCYAAGVRGCSARVWVLRGVSLQVDEGERVAVIGAAGAGKSTLARCIVGLIRCDVGLIERASPLHVFDDFAPWTAPSAARRVAGDQRLPVEPALAATASAIAFLRHADFVRSWADRVFELRDGRLRPVLFQPALRVAERALIASHCGFRLR